MGELLDFQRRGAYNYEFILDLKFGADKIISDLKLQGPKCASLGSQI